MDFYMSSNFTVDTHASKLTEIGFRILLCLLGIFGNSALLFYTMPTINCRIEPYKILLINLALSDLLTNCMVDIPGILVEMYGTWFLGDYYCKIFLFTGNLSITSSILTTLTMSIFWFQKLVGSRPIKCKIIQAVELRLLRIYLTLSWLVSIVFSIPLLYYCSVYVLKNDSGEEGQHPGQKVFGCHNDFPSRFHKHIYEITYLILANALPTMVMFFINVRIIIFLVRNRKRIGVLRCAGTNVRSVLDCSVPSCGDRIKTKCQDSKGHKGQTPGTSGQVRDMVFQQTVSCFSAATTELEFVTIEKTLSDSEGAVKVIINNVGRRELVQQYLTSLGKNALDGEEQRHTPTSIIHDPCIFNYNEQVQKTVVYKASRSVLIPETDCISIGRNTGKPEGYNTSEQCPTAFTCPREQCTMGNDKVQPPAVLVCTSSLHTKAHRVPKTTARNPFATTQIRAMMSIMAVVSVFLIFWATHLTLRIKENTSGSDYLMDTASLLAASYTTIVPYIFIYSMRKCPCSH